MLRFLKKYYFVFVTVLLCSGVIALDWNLQRSAKEANAKILRLEQLRNQIIYYDEVLTMTARLGALTNNHNLKDRYDKFAALLDLALAELKLVAIDDVSVEIAKATEQANNVLLAIEESAFELIKEGNSAEAESRLFSEEYAKYKEIYAKGMMTLDESIKSRIEDLNAKVRQSNLIRIVTVLVTVMFLLVVAVAAVRAKNRLKENEVSLSLALEEARSSERAKAQFLAKMTHEVRTPLNGIYGLAQVFKADNLDVEQLKYLDIIKDSCHMLMAIVNDVLDFSALESGKMRLHKQPFNLET